MPDTCVELRRAAAREIECDLEPLSDRNFRNFKILRPKSREIAPKSMPLGGAQLAYDP